MSNFSQLIATAGLAVVMAGCAPLNTTKPTLEKVATVAAPNEALFDAATTYAKAQDWTIEVADRGLGYIEAVSAVDSSAGFTTRERWIISTRDHEVGIRLAMEFREAGKWNAVEMVCNSYSYGREQMHLGAIAQLASDSAIASASSGLAVGTGHDTPDASLASSTQTLSFSRTDSVPTQENPGQ